MRRTALIAGSTGLIGGQLLDLLLTDDNYSSVIAISRKPLSRKNAKLINVVCELGQIENHSNELKADDIFCCLGTTMRKAKSKIAFRTVDFDAPLTLAKITKTNGASQFLLVSALGANKNSSIFYNQVKGEVEEAIRQIGFPGFQVFRPSLLLGPRTESRSGEDAAKVFYKLFGWAIPKKYKAIESIRVAKAMLNSAQQEKSGVFIYESSELHT